MVMTPMLPLSAINYTFNNKDENLTHYRFAAGMLFKFWVNLTYILLYFDIYVSIWFLLTSFVLIRQQVFFTSKSLIKFLRYHQWRN